MVKQFRQVARQIGLIPATEVTPRLAIRQVRSPVDRRRIIGEVRVEAIQLPVPMASIVEKETAVPEERPCRQRLLQPAGEKDRSRRRPQYPFTPSC